jgi:hypothetical protein
VDSGSQEALQPLASAKVAVQGWARRLRGGVDSHGNPLDQIGSLLVVADLTISGNGAFRVDATA